MKLFYHVLAFCLWAAAALPAQQHQCGTDIAQQKLRQEHPHLQRLGERLDLAIYKRLTALGGKQPTLSGNQTYTIPVVVHIVHNSGAENISDSQVLEGIRHINEAFSNLQLDASTKVSFVLCMAQQDEAGRATSGITRTTSELTDMVIELHDRPLKDLVRWSPANYLNIWIVRSIASTSVGSGVVGYAMMPASHGNPEDGLVIEAGFFGVSTERSVVGIHELGHYFGLYHTFEGGCTNSNCLLDGDRVCDTPPDASTAHTECSQPMNSCSTDEDDHSANNPFRPVSEGGLGDQSDMISNFMDYSELACQRAFTTGQARRMVAALLESRSSLLSSYGCWPPCIAPLTASFSANRSAVYAGETVAFTNTSAGAAAYRWRINGIEFSTSRNASYVFTTPGVYIVGMEASNSEAPCTRIAYDTITVTCGIVARLTADRTFIDPNTEVHFTNTTGTSASEFAWYVDGELKSRDRNYTHRFVEPGSYTIMLVASNSFCSDTAYAFITVSSCSNKYDYVWYFGAHLGLDFATEPPTVLSDGALWAFEGCATMCTSEGQLLFYTDGAKVWDRLHRIMPGGDSTLGGHHSSMQGSVIVPRPGHPSQYYIFTADALENNYRKGLSYAVVDLSLNGGAGEVTDIVIGITTNIGEAVTAIAHANARDYWVVVRDWNNAFHSYLVSDAGVAATPVTSVVRRGAGGVLKFSPSGTMLAVGWMGGVGALFPFDAATGKVSDEGSITLSRPMPSELGIEFSPDGKFLYISGMTTPTQSAISQYDLTAGNGAAIVASAVDIPEPNLIGNLQLAPNGKIYVGRYWDTPGVINEPNKKGVACDYQPAGITLPNPDGTGRYRSNLGLPNFVHRRVPFAHTEITGPKNLCTPATASYVLSDGECDPTLWIHRGKNAVSFSNDSSAVHVQFDSPGVDTLIVMYSKGCAIGGDTLFINSDIPPVISLGPDTALCDNNRPIVLDAGPGFTSYSWQNGSTSQTLTIPSPGTYYVTVVSAGGCTASDTITVYESEAPVLALGSDTTVCAGKVLVLDAGAGFRNYRWQDGSGNRTFTAYSEGIYNIEVESICGEILRDTIVVQHLPATMPTLGDTTLCLGGSVRLAALADAASFVWSPPDGLDNPTSPTPIASPTATTSYTVSATTSEGCVQIGKVTVVVLDKDTPIALRLPDTTAVPGDVLHLPIYLDVASSALPLHIPSLHLAVRYRSALLMGTALSNGTYAIARDGDYETMSIDVRDLTITQSSTVVTELVGNVFLGNSPSTALIVDSVFAGGCLAPDKMSGQLTISGVCAPSIRQIRLRSIFESAVEVLPNPAADIATVQATTSEEGTHTTAVYDLQGRLLWSSNFVHSGSRAAHVLPIELRDIPAGLYRVVLISPGGAATATLSVVK